jgi:hypothetical protein
MEKQNESKIVYVVSEFNEDEEPPSNRVIEVHKTSDFEILANRSATKANNERIKTSQQSLDFMQLHFPLATEKDWSSWNWQIRNSITNIEQLKRICNLTDSEIKPISDKNNSLPLRITPYYASLIATKGGIRSTI